MLPGRTLTAAATALSWRTLRVLPSSVCCPAPVTHSSALRTPRAFVTTPSETTTAVPRRRTHGAGRRRGAATGATHEGASRTQERPHSSPNRSEGAVEEQRLQEGDVRLAMRSLMTRHFALQLSLHRPVREQERQERARLQAQHAAREERLEQKRRNSLQLMSGDAVALGDGIVPFFSRATPSTTDPQLSPRDTTPSTWNRLNPVGVAAMMKTKQSDDTAATRVDDVEAAYCDQLGQLSAKEWETVTLQALCQPDLSMYESAQDVRINSAEVALREQARRQSLTGEGTDGVRDGDAAASLTPDAVLDLDEMDFGATSTHSGGADTPERASRTAQLRRYLAEEDEDHDFSISPYVDDAGEESDL